MVWNYHDNNDLNVPDSPVTIRMKGIPAKKVLIHHYRIDQHFSNSYTLWKSMGSPQDPTAEQIAKLEQAGQLKLYTSPEWATTKDGKLNFSMKLPRQAVSLLVLEY